MKINISKTCYASLNTKHHLRQLLRFCNWLYLQIVFLKFGAENSETHAAEDGPERRLGLITHSNRRGAEKHEHAHINMHAQATGSTLPCSHTYTPVKPPVLIG